MSKKLFLFMLLLLASFIAGFYQWNLFHSSEPLQAIYFYVLLFIDAIIIAMALIVFKYIFHTKSP